MKIKYLKACQEDGLTTEQIKEIEKVFDPDKKRRNGNYTQMTIERLDEMVDNISCWKADTIAELAEKVGIDSNKLVQTVEEHNKQIKENLTDAFNTPVETMIPITEGPFYIISRQSGMIGTIVGVKVDDNMHVLSQEGDIINNLYATGEMIYGNWFNKGYPMSGTGLGGCVSSGRLAAQDAVANLK